MTTKDPDATHGIDEPGAVPSAPASNERTWGEWRMWVAPGVALLLVLVLGSLRLSGSSIGVYTEADGSTAESTDLVAGETRFVRGDEWLVRTPLVLSQEINGLPDVAAGGVGEHDVNITDLPASGWEVILRPHTIPYHLFGAEVALALEWWLLALVQAAGVYFLIGELTRRPVIAAASAVLVTLSPATQWWTGPGTFASLGYGSLSVALLLMAFRAPSRGRRIALAVGAGFVGAAFAKTFYPPWQVGTALVLLPVFAGAVAPDLFDRSARRAALGRLGTVLGAAALASGVLVAGFGLAHRDAFEGIANTEYPGERTAESGGGVPIPRMFGSALDHFSEREDEAAVNGTNQSENAAGLVLVLPVALATFAVGSAGGLARRRDAYPLLGVLVGAGVLVSWMLLPLPSWAGRPLLLGVVQPGRLSLPLALASVVSLALLVSYLKRDGRTLGVGTRVVCAGSFAAVQLWAADSYTVNGLPIDLSRAALLIVIVSVGVWFALGPRSEIGYGLLAAFVLWQAVHINPLQQGTAPLTDSELSRAVREVAADQPLEAGWVAFGASLEMRGAITATGVNNLAGVSPYPDEELWRTLDDDGDDEEIWNRYAHIHWAAGSSGSEPEFALLSPDAIAVTVDPCDQRLSELGVGIVVMRNAELDGCATELRSVDFGPDTVRIYELSG
jgi:hypothetical protein